MAEQRMKVRDKKVQKMTKDGLVEENLTDKSSVRVSNRVGDVQMGRKQGEKEVTDHLYVDEAHSYKNAFLYTKMRNVAGIAQNEAQKSADMFNKCQYLDEITGGKGITFATGTPISNSMTELYVMQRYLQNSKLQNMGLGLFDSWASTFGEVVTSIEFAQVL